VLFWRSHGGPGAPWVRKRFHLKVIERPPQDPLARFLIAELRQDEANSLDRRELGVQLF
jgi:hypothetical protein